MPTIQAPKPFIDILRRFLREGTHPGEFILSIITENSLTEACVKADDWNASNLWHIGAIIREYVPLSLRKGDLSIEDHMDIMQTGHRNFHDIKEDGDRAYFNYMKDWDIPPYVEEIEKRPFHSGEVIKVIGLDSILIEEARPSLEVDDPRDDECPDCAAYIFDTANNVPCRIHQK